MPGLQSQEGNRSPGLYSSKYGTYMYTTAYGTYKNPLHTHTHTCNYANTYTMFKYTNIRARAHTYMYTYTHTHTHSYSLSWSGWVSPGWLGTSLWRDRPQSAAHRGSSHWAAASWLAHTPPSDQEPYALSALHTMQPTSIWNSGTCTVTHIVTLWGNGHLHCICRRFS